MQVTKKMVVIAIAFVLSSFYGLYWYKKGAIDYKEKKIDLLIESYIVEYGVTNFTYQIKFNN